MIKSFWQKAWPHLAAIGIFLIIAVMYCSPALNGKVLSQHDTQGWKGMAHQAIEFREKNGYMPYWNNNSFSGMPGYQIAYEPHTKFSIGYLHDIFTLGLPKPINFFFLACLMMYFLLVVAKVNPWIGVLGGLAYAYSTFDPIIVGVGHDTQMICIAYAPAVIGSLLLLFRKNYLAGTVLSTLSISMIIFQNHVQITYYTIITALAISVAFFINAVRNKELAHGIKAGALAVLAGVLALGVCAANLFPLNEYAKETMRVGRTELTDTTNTANKSKGGLDKDYAFHYGSYGVTETFTFIVPGIYGGTNAGSELKEGKSVFADKLSEVGVPAETALQYANGSAYWGNQPGHAGPVYLGAVICFLFICSLVFVKGWLKWGLLTATAFAIVLSWGKNFESLNYFLFDHLPMYNKFRAPSMALVIPQLSFVVLGCLALNEMLFGSLSKEERWKKFIRACYITGGVLLLLVIMYFSFDYSGPNDASLKESFSNGMLQQISQGQQPTPQMQQQADSFGHSLISAIHSDRQSLYGKDLLRSLVFILLAAGAIALCLKQKLHPLLAIAIVLVISTADLLMVDTRYLDSGHYKDPDEIEADFTPTAADSRIMADPDKNFRVFDQAAAEGPFTDSRASYFFNSIGGYSPAKLALYQDIIERQLSKGNINVFNMLNTKYFIVQNQSTRQPEAQLNPGALGNAWFVKGFSFAKNADDEMNKLSTLNTKDSALVDVRYEKQAGPEPVFDSTASIKMTENLVDKITYKSTAASSQFAVLSEVYYPQGWNAYIDGNPAPYIRVNYVLRGMQVPAGSHTIEFRFEPRSVIISAQFSTWSTLVVYLMLLAAIVLAFMKKKNSGLTAA